jgi:hypothetical protein
MVIVFRYDDVCGRILAIDHDVVQKFSDYAVPLTLGFIPFLYPVSYDEMQSLLHDDLHEWALHGYAHQSIVPHSNKLQTEFCGLDLKSQSEKIGEGMVVLTNFLKRSIQTFIPPWNSYDANTLEALMAHRIPNISGGMHRSFPHHSMVNSLPATIPIGQFYQLLYAGAFDSLFDQPVVIVVYFHAYELKESGIVSPYSVPVLTMDQLTHMLKRITTDPRVQCESVSGFLSRYRILPKEIEKRASWYGKIRSYLLNQERFFLPYNQIQ